MITILTISALESVLDILHSDLEKDRDIEFCNKGDAVAGFGMALGESDFSILAKTIAAVAALCRAIVGVRNRTPKGIIKVSNGKEKFEIHADMTAHEVERILKLLISNE